jgi:L-fuconolactonase
VTEADHKSWKEKDLLPYLETVLEAFGPSRLMFGSDWPVCLLATSYGAWLSIIRRFIAPLSTYEQSSILAHTALRTYQIDLDPS